jgi:uroporphyrinogen-III decarboxylase
MSHAMTSRQRMLAAIHHEPVDRVPVSPWGMGRIPMNSPLGVEMVTRTDPWLEVGLGCDAVGGAALHVESTRDGAQERRVVRANGRDLTATLTTTAQTVACTEYMCKDEADIEALLSVPYVRPQPDVDAFHALRRHVGEEGLVVMGVPTGLCYPNDVLGTEYCSLLWAMQPDLIAHMVDMATRRTLEIVREACEGGVDCFRLVGGEYATELMGRRAWDELVVPHDTALVELIHSFGGIVHYHNHGRMQRFLERIADLGIDSLDPIEQPPYGDISMAEAMSRIGDRVCLVGGLDDMEVLETRPTEEVLSMAETLLERAGRTGYMLGGTSSGIYGETAARHFIALVDVAERYAP